MFLFSSLICLILYGELLCRSLMGVRGTASQFGVLGGPCLFSRIVHHPITSQDVSDINDRFRSCLYSISKFTCSLTTTEKRKNSTLLAFAPFLLLYRDH